MRFTVVMILMGVVNVCRAECEIARSKDDDVDVLIKETHKVDNDVWIRPDPSFKKLNISVFARSIPIMRETFPPLEWSCVTTKVLYSNTLNKCAIGVTVNDKKQFVVVARCGSGLSFIHQDSVMAVRVSGGAQISISCDPAAYKLATPSPLQVERSDTPSITIFAILVICICIALAYLKVKVAKLERRSSAGLQMPVRLGVIEASVENRYNEDLAVGCEA